MHETDFKVLSARLLESGIAPAHACRTISELQDHYNDLVDEAMAAGAEPAEARQKAAHQLGDMDEFVTAMKSCPELKSWAFRYPRLALILYPLACLLILPATPVFAGLTHRLTIARWGTSLLLAGVITASILLVLQLTILFA